MATVKANAINSSSLGAVPNGTDGQLLTGATGAKAQFSTLVSNTLTQTGGSNSLTLNVIRLATGVNGWTLGQATGTIGVNGAYIVTTVAQTLTLQANPVQGDIFYIFNQGSGTAVIDYATNIGSGTFYFNGAAAVSNPTLAVFSSCVIVCTQGGANPIYQVISVNGTLT